MFLTENFKNFIKSSVSSAVLAAYNSSSFSSITNALMNVCSRIKSKVSLSNGLLSVFDMALQDEDPEYLGLMNTDMNEAVNHAIHKTEYGDEIQSALSELADLSKDCGVSDDTAPASGQYRSISMFGPDGKEYDFVLFNTPVQVQDSLCYVATCEEPSELADCMIFSTDGVMMINPIIRGVDFVDGYYYPSSNEAKVLYFSQLYGMHTPIDASMHDQLLYIANDLGLEVDPMLSEIFIVNLILSDYFEDDTPRISDLGNGLNRMLYDAASELGLDELSGSITTISTLASAFAEQVSVDDLHVQVIDTLIHNHFDVSVLNGLTTQAVNMRESYSACINKLHQAVACGGITGLAAYIIEYYRQSSNQSSSLSEDNTWVMSSQSTLVPKNFVCNVGSIILQVFAVLAQVIGSFWGAIGMVIGNVLSAGFTFLSKLVNFVNDKGRCFYTTDLSFLPAANISIFQTYLDDRSVSTRLMELLLANPSVYTIVPGAIIVLSLDRVRHRIIFDVHPMYNDVDLTELIMSSTAYPAIIYCDAYFRKKTVSEIINWYGENAELFSVSYDPSASEVADEDKEVANSYLSAASDANMLMNLRHNTTVFYAFLIAISKDTIPYAGFEGYQGGHHTSDSPLLTEALFCGLYDWDANHGEVINTGYGWGTSWTSYIQKLDQLCSWGRSLWDPDYPGFSAKLFTDSSNGTYPSQYGSTDVPLSYFLHNLVTVDNAYILSDFVQISNDAQWSLIAPKWNSASFWQVFIGTAIVAAVIATAVIISSVAISRKIAASRAKRQASVEAAWSEYTKNPSDSELYENYRKSVRSNNLFANVFGGTKYSKNNYWETIGGESTPTSSSGEGDTIITRIYDQAFGTDVNPDPTNEIITLIRGNV